MATVRYLVHDVSATVNLYRQRLRFRVVMHPAPESAMLARGDPRLTLVSPVPADHPVAGQGRARMAPPQGPGGWIRFALEVDGLTTTVIWLRAAGGRFRNEIATGVGGKQVLV